MTRFFLPHVRNICLGLVSLAFLASGALAQTTVSVIGPITPGNIPQFNSTTVIKDSGVPSGAIGAALPPNSFICNPTGSTAPGQNCNKPWFSVKDFGAKGDGIQLSDGVTTAGSPIITSASASFTSADIGKRISVTFASTVTISIASPAVITWTNHGLAAGDRVTFLTTGALPTGIVASLPYYVSATGLTANTFQILPSPGVAAVNTTGTQSGTQTVFANGSSAGFNGVIASINSATSINATTNVGSTSALARVFYGADDTTAFQNAATAHPLIYAPIGIYMLTAAVNFSGSGGGLIGDGTGSTILHFASTTSKGLVSNAGNSFANFNNFQITRTGTAIAGATNLDLSAGATNANISDLFLERGSINLFLGSTTFSRASRITLQYGMSDGLRMDNSIGASPVQWQLDDIISSVNAGSGFRVVPVTASATLGEWRNVETFANGGNGIALAGTVSFPVSDVRLTNAFLGQDYFDELFVDTHGGTVLVQGSSWFESSTTGAGIVQASTAGNASFEGVTLNANATNGASFSGTSWEFTGGNVVANGQTGIAGLAGNGRIIGSRVTGSTNGVGIALVSPAVVAVIGNDVTGNTTPISPGTSTGSTIVNNIGVSNTIANSLGADVLLNNTANYFDGPSVAQGTTGTWFVSGTVTLLDTVGTTVFCKLWDGTTVVSSGSTNVVAAGAAAMGLSGILTSPAANLRISCRDSVDTTAKILFNNSLNSKDSTITALRVQ